tara:strand:- start:153 stop:383 length:231 start_codon:yes stop_codon:yes gene_type:complete
MKVKVYFHIHDKETSMLFDSKEFGCIEYFDDVWSIRYKNIEEAILSSYIKPGGGGFNSLKDFRKSNYGKLIYLGEL